MTPVLNPNPPDPDDREPRRRHVNRTATGALVSATDLYDPCSHLAVWAARDRGPRHGSLELREEAEGL